ncbi:MAG: agmatinase, partial [Thermodesulfobacteriota bacterium]
PFDEGVGFRPGARFGPRAVREYSMRFAYFDPAAPERGYWDLEKRKRLLTDVTLLDCGDVDIVPLDRVYVYDQIDAAVKEIIKQGAFPVFLGGDHSVTYPIVSAFKDGGPLSIVQLDAHLDRRDEVVSSKYGHGSPIRRISELSFIESISTIGIRGLRAPERDFREAEARGDVLILSHEVHEKGTDAIIQAVPQMDRCYVTIDIDALDPAIAPGTGTPEADGLSYRQIKTILSGIAKRSQIVGFDLVEVNPGLDPSGRTPLFAAQLCVEFLGAIFEHKKKIKNTETL